MKKLLTDVHTHSTFSCDGITPLKEMLECALKKGLAFYGVAEHFDYDLALEAKEDWTLIDPERYFHEARHLQEDYEGAMNVLIGGEFGYTDDIKAQEKYAEIYEKYRPDFVVNSLHCKDGWDYYSRKIMYVTNGNGETVLREKKDVYTDYLTLVERSLDAPYPYDIIGHFGYIARYWPIQSDMQLRYADHAEQIDRILKKIIQKDKILELNSSCRGLSQVAVTGEDILQRYYELGGRKVSFASDAHHKDAIARGREQVVELLKKVGFTYITVPCKGEHIKVEI